MFKSSRCHRAAPAVEPDPHCLSCEHLGSTYGGERDNFLFAFQSPSEFKPQFLQSQVRFSKVGEYLREITICFTVVLCTQFGDVEREKMPLAMCRGEKGPLSDEENGIPSLALRAYL